jgi:hypothetical protein
LGGAGEPPEPGTHEHGAFGKIGVHGFRIAASRLPERRTEEI